MQKLFFAFLWIFLPWSLGSDSLFLTSAQAAELPALTIKQKATLLQEGKGFYEEGVRLAKDSPADAKEAFAQAVEKLLLVHRTSPPDVRLLLNLGNAYWQAEESGKAIARYRQAVALDPSSSLARKNLQQALEESPELAMNPAGQVPFVPPHWAATIDAWNHLVAWSGRDFLFLLTWAAFWLVLAVAWWWPMRWLGGMALVLGSACLFLFLSIQWDHLRWQQRDFAVIVENDLPLRSGSGMVFAPLKGDSLPAGQTVQIVQQRADWLLIRAKEGREGWMPGSAVEPLYLRQPLPPSTEPVSEKK
ncbi:Hypothetical protein PBC10988_28880 [Planctomycetales bacterium 10988]|nr:Hypothetical protein PBC10988_28880 [Planctomycetales bacterium 10988]